MIPPEGAPTEPGAHRIAVGGRLAASPNLDDLTLGPPFSTHEGAGPTIVQGSAAAT